MRLPSGCLFSSPPFSGSGYALWWAWAASALQGQFLASAPGLEPWACGLLSRPRFIPGVVVSVSVEVGPCVPARGARSSRRSLARSFVEAKTLTGRIWVLLSQPPVAATGQLPGLCFLIHLIQQLCPISPRGSRQLLMEEASEQGTGPAFEPESHSGEKRPGRCFCLQLRQGRGLVPAGRGVLLRPLSKPLAVGGGSRAGSWGCVWEGGAAASGRGAELSRGAQPGHAPLLTLQPQILLAERLAPLAGAGKEALGEADHGAGQEVGCILSEPQAAPLAGAVSQAPGLWPATVEQQVPSCRF